MVLRYQTEKMIFKLKWPERFFVFALPLLLLQSLSACSTPKTVSSQDSLPGITREYNGYRLVIADIVVKKRKSKSANLQYEIINTGRESIFHKKGKVASPPIFFEFDKSLKKAELVAYKEDIIREVLSNDITIRTGQSLKKKTMKLRLDPNRKAMEEDIDFRISVGDNNSKGKDYIDRNFCADISIDTIIITRQTKKWATIEYHISNKGKGPASFRGETNKDEDNLAIKAYLNRTGKLSKGAIPIGGAFVNDKELLKPGEIYIGVIRLDISKKTRYSSMLILELDPYLAIRECDETNNKAFISLDD